MEVPKDRPYIPTSFGHARLFVGPFARLPRNARLARLEGHAEALDLEARRAKCPLTQQQLEGDHGDKWEERGKRILEQTAA